MEGGREEVEKGRERWADLGRAPPSNQLSQEVEEDKESDVHFPHDRVSTVVPGDMVERGGSCEGR